MKRTMKWAGLLTGITLGVAISLAGPALAGFDISSDPDTKALLIKSGGKICLDGDTCATSIKGDGTTVTVAGALAAGAFSPTGNITIASGADLTAAGGDTAVDLSAGSGLFKTPTGAVTVGPGAVTVSGNTTITGTFTTNSTAQLNGTTTVAGALNNGSDWKAHKGSDVASAAGNIVLGTGTFFDITGTDAITSITAKLAGTIVVLQFDSTATLVDGSNLKLSAAGGGSADDTITLISDGTNWYEIGRSAN